MKTCRMCGEDKPSEAFYRNTSGGLYSYCKPCKAAWLRQHRRDNPEYWREWNRDYKARNRERIREQAKGRYQADPDAARKALAWRINKLGLSMEEYDALTSQPCALCGATENIVVDHCHETNQVRGPLCQGCNTGLGKFGDNPARLRAAADYIEGK